MTTQIQVLRSSLETDATLTVGMASQLRGALAASKPDDVLLHHHEKNGAFIYLYPRVQYKVIDKQAKIFALEEGVDAVAPLLQDVHSLQIGQTNVKIKEIQTKRSQEAFGCAPEMRSYRFIRPWIALNQINLQIYRLSSDHDRRRLLEKILIGNCISLSKSIGYEVQERLRAETHLRSVPIHLKNTPMMGFVGRFRINFDLPDWIGIGKSVSRGFGTIVRQEDQGADHATRHQ